MAGGWDAGGGLRRGPRRRRWAAPWTAGRAWARAGCRGCGCRALGCRARGRRLRGSLLASPPPVSFTAGITWVFSVSDRALVGGVVGRLVGLVVVEDGQTLVAHGGATSRIGWTSDPSVADGRRRAHPGSLVDCGKPSGGWAAGPAQTPRKRLIASRCWARISLVAHAEPLLGSQAEHAHLALVGVAVDVERGLADVVEPVGLRQCGMDHALGDEPVCLPRLAVVREVGRDDPLEVHPQVAVVVLVHVAGRRGARRDRAALAGDVDRGAEGLAAGVLEDDVDVLAAGQLTDPGAEALPLLGVLGVPRPSRTGSPPRSG